MIASAARVKYETLRTLAYTGLSGSFAAIGTPFQNPVRIIKINNTTDVDLYISYNGVDNHDFVAAGSAFVFDYASNKYNPVGQLEQSAYERPYAAIVSGAPTGGLVTVTVIYASSR